MSSYVPKLYDKYSSKFWNYGESPQYDVVLEEKTVIGNIDINLSVESGRIVKAKIFSDTLENINLGKVEEQLIGIIFARDEVVKLIDDYIRQVSEKYV